LHVLKDPFSAPCAAMRGRNLAHSRRTDKGPILRRLDADIVHEVYSPGRPTVWRLR